MKYYVDIQEIKDRDYGLAVWWGKTPVTVLQGTSKELIGLANQIIEHAQNIDHIPDLYYPKCLGTLTEDDQCPNHCPYGEHCSDVTSDTIEAIRSDSVGLCSWCGGSGQLEKTNHQGEYPQKYDCPVCNGTGKEPIKSDSLREEKP